MTNRPRIVGGCAIKVGDLPALMGALGGSGDDDLLTLLSARCTGREADRHYAISLTGTASRSASGTGSTSSLDEQP